MAYFTYNIAKIWPDFANRRKFTTKIFCTLLSFLSFATQNLIQTKKQKFSKIKTKLTKYKPFCGSNTKTLRQSKHYRPGSFQSTNFNNQRRIVNKNSLQLQSLRTKTPNKRVDSGQSIVFSLKINNATQKRTLTALRKPK
jgi:hypothetical protein